MGQVQFKQLAYTFAVSFGALFQQYARVDCDLGDRIIYLSIHITLHDCCLRNFRDSCKLQLTMTSGSSCPKVSVF
jgi:hypothetical protein